MEKISNYKYRKALEIVKEYVNQLNTDKSAV